MTIKLRWFAGALAILALLCAGPASSQKILILAGGCGQATSAINRLTAPTAQTINRLQSAICGLVKAGTWNKLDALWIPQADSSTNAALNLVSASYTLTTPAGNCIFAASYGYECDGQTGYFATGMVPSTAGGHYTQNSASFGFSVINNRTTINTYAGMGNVTNNVGRTLLLPLSNGTGGSASINNVATANGVFSSTSSIGNWVVSRTSSAGFTVSRNGSTILTDVSDTSTTLPNTQFLIGAANLSTGTISDFSADNISFAFIGGGLTAGDITALNTAANIFNNKYDYPLEAANDGFHTVKFTTNFSSLARIDTSGTCPTNGTFDFTTTVQWPNASNTGNRTMSSTNPAGITLNSAGNGINIQQAGPYALVTACSDGASGYRGTIFSGGGLIRCSINFNPANFVGGQNPFPGCYSVGMNHLLLSNVTRYIELDYAQAVPTGTGTFQSEFGAFDWTITSPPSGTLSGNSSNNSEQFNATSCNSGNAVTYTQFHVYTTIWRPINGAVQGKISRYWDNCLFSTSNNFGFFYNTTTGASPVFQPSNPTGVFSEIDTDVGLLGIITAGAGTGNPQNINEYTFVSSP